MDESLAGLTGQEFFQQLVHSLAQALSASCAFVCEFTDDCSRARPLALSHEGEFIEAGAFDLAGTPCECVLAGDIAFFERRVAQLFPDDRAGLEALGAESYLAIPLKSRSGPIIGHLAVIDARPRDWAEADFGVLRIFASRATAELQHERAAKELADANRALEERVRVRTQELADAKESMEQRVAERTAALSAINTRLRYEIAARLEAETALRRQEEAYRDLYEHAPNVYWSTGTDGRLKRANKRAEELFGYSLDELVGKPLAELVANEPTARETLRRVFQRFLEGQPSYDFELEFRAKDGRPIWTTVNVVPIFDEHGKPVMTRSMVTDITERKRAEQALEQRLALERLLVEVATGFNSAGPDLVDSAFDEAIARIGSWGRWDRVRVFLQARQETPPALAYQWRAAGVGDAPPVHLVPERSRRRRGVLIDVPDVGHLRDKGLKQLLSQQRVGALIVVPIANSAARRGFVEMVRFGRPHSWLPEDVQLLRLLGEIMASTLARCDTERELERARAGAVAASSAKSEFLARMSHELRTPLNAILGYAQLLTRDEQMGSRQAAQLETIRRSGEHLLGLINEVLDLARVESGNVDVRAVDFDLRGLVGDVEAMFAPRAAGAGVRFSARVDPHCPRRVRVDDRRLRQILINLLGNSVKFTPRGGEVELHVAAQRASASAWNVQVRVRDTGIGVAAHELERIFEPFYQVAGGEADGMGLGLAITRRLVEALDGGLRVSSEVGKGTTFTVTLELEEAPAHAAAAAAPRVIGGYAGERHRILIVDDSAENRALLRNLLEPLGFDVHEAEQGGSALAGIDAAAAPSLVLMDLFVPGGDNLATVRQLGARCPGTRIVAVSASAFEQTRDQALAAGCHAFLAKPVDLDELLRVIGGELELEWLHVAHAGRPDDAGELPAGVAPPPERLEELYELARAGDVAAIQAALEGLAGDPLHGALAAHLRTLTAEFDMRGLQACLELLMHSPEPAARPAVP